MAKQMIPSATSHDTDPEGSRPETDFEHSQRYLNDIDRNTWRGTHAPAKGAKGMIHKISVAENAPHIFKAV